MKIDLYNGDCLEVMKQIPDGSVDLILCDPPYGMNYQSNYRKVKHKKIDSDLDISILKNNIKELDRVLKADRHIYIFMSFHNIQETLSVLSMYFKVKNILIWEKNNTSMGDLKGDYAPKYEMIVYCHKGRRELLGGFRYPNIFKFDRTKNELHPTQKPVDLLEFLIKNSTQENETVLDFTMGSGSTGVACKNLNRNFIGIELDKKYFKIAKKRIGQ